MKLLIVVLAILALWFQYKLWLSPNGVVETVRLNKDIAVLAKENKTLQDRNAVLKADVKDLKAGDEAVEERARSELGMIKKGEVFYQVVH